MLRKWAGTASVIIAILATAPGALGAPQDHADWTLKSVLGELDQEAKDFHSLSADVERTKVTVVVNVRSTESGKIWVRGEKMLLKLTKPALRTILKTGDALYVYTPGLKRVEQFSLGKHRALVDQFLLLGFGTSGHDLRKGYLVTLLDQPVLDHRQTVLLELTPKSTQVRNQISKIHLWLDEATWLPVQQKFFETGTQDYFVIRYSDMVRNARIPESLFKPRWPKGTQKLRPQT